MSDIDTMEISASGSMTRNVEETPKPSKKTFLGLYNGLSELKQRARKYAIQCGWQVPSTPAATPAAAARRGSWSGPPTVERLLTPSGIDQLPKDQPKKVTITMEQYQEYERLRRGLTVASRGGTGRREVGRDGQDSGDHRGGRGASRGTGRGIKARLGSRGRGNGSHLVEEEKDRIYNESKNIINRRKRAFTVDEREQMRSLGGSCSRCRGNHGAWECTYKKEELICSYPPCFDKKGHSIGACHDLMKRCRLDICQDQRGHRATCHSYMPGGKKYGFGAEAVEALKRAYEDHRYLLTQEEKKRIALYEEEKKKQEEERRKEEKEQTPFREHPDYDLMEVEGGEQTPGGGPTRNGRNPRPSPYGRWIFGGFNR